MRRFVIALMISLAALSAGCSSDSVPLPAKQGTGEKTTQAGPAETLQSLLQRHDVEALVRLAGEQGLRVAAYAADGGKVLKGQELRDVLQSLLKDSKPEVVAYRGSGQTLSLAVRGLNQVDLPGESKLRSTEMVGLTLEFEEPNKYRLVTLVIDTHGLFASEVKAGGNSGDAERWQAYKKP